MPCGNVANFNLVVYSHFAVDPGHESGEDPRRVLLQLASPLTGITLPVFDVDFEEEV